MCTVCICKVFSALVVNKRCDAKSHTRITLGCIQKTKLDASDGGYTRCVRTHGESVYNSKITSLQQGALKFVLVICRCWDPSQGSQSVRWCLRPLSRASVNTSHISFIELLPKGEHLVVSTYVTRSKPLRSFSLFAV